MVKVVRAPGQGGMAAATRAPIGQPGIQQGISSLILITGTRAMLRTAILQ